MSGSEEKKLNSLHEEDSLYKVQGGKAAYEARDADRANALADRVKAAISDKI